VIFEGPCFSRFAGRDGKEEREKGKEKRENRKEKIGKREEKTTDEHKYVKI